MCRQRKVNRDIVLLNKRASPCISKGHWCGGVFSSGGLLNVSLTWPRVRPGVPRVCMREALWGRGVVGVGVLSGEAVRTLCNRGNSVRGSHSDNARCCLPARWRANIFSAKRCVNRANISDWADSFKKIFPLKTNTYTPV